MSPLVQASYFLIETCFFLYTTVVLLRFLLQLVRANFHNPFCEFVIKATNSLVIPIRRVVPGLFGIDLSSLVLLYLLAMMKIFLLSLLFGKAIGSISVDFFLGCLVLATGDIISLTLSTYTFIIFVSIVLSWFSHIGYNPIVEVFNSLTYPILGRIKRFSPDLGVIDISPMIAIILIQLMHILIAGPVTRTGKVMIGSFW